MRFDIYGRFVVEVIREDDCWIAYRVGEGIRRRAPDLVIPSDIDSSELVTFLDDVYHELACPGQRIRRVG